LAVLDYSDFHKQFSNVYVRKIRETMNEFDNSSTDIQRLSRHVLSHELTYFVNLATEFDLIQNARSLFDRKWKGWSLEYHGMDRPMIRSAAEYDFCWRVARGKPADFFSIWREKDDTERSKIRYLSGLLFKDVQSARYNRPYRYSNALKTIADIYT